MAAVRQAKNWIAVASAEHARRGRDAAQGYMQVCHGKSAPLKRVQPGDCVAYYAPALVMGGKQPFQHFVSMGLVQAGSPFEFDTGGGFVPWRRNVAYVAAQEAPVAPLLDQFEFVENRQRWGYKFRFGLFEINAHDMQLIAHAMQVQPESLLFQ